MHDKKEGSHPLYPKPEETYQRISLYPPKECDNCSKIGFDVEWREILSGSNSDMKKLCKRCLLLENNYDSWSGWG